MKNNNLILVVILAIFSITILLLFNRNNCVNIYCNQSTKQPNNCNRSPIPEKLDSINTTLYYKVDDNCNFQTLVFDASNNSPYTVIGRFSGQYLSNNKYQIDKLEFVTYNLKRGTIHDYKVKEVIHKKTSSENHTYFKIIMEKRNEEDTQTNSVDHIYNKKPVIINTNAVISFEIDIPSKPIITTGGYECNGRAVVSPPTGP